MKSNLKDQKNILIILETSRMIFSMSVVKSSKIAKINKKSSVCVSKKFIKKISIKNSFICGNNNYFGGYCCCCDKMTMGTSLGLRRTM